jgi:hypothetical protein
MSARYAGREDAQVDINEDVGVGRDGRRGAALLGCNGGMSGEGDKTMLMTRCVVLPRVREDSASPSDLYKHQDQAKWGGISELGAVPIWAHRGGKRRNKKQGEA